MREISNYSTHVHHSQELRKSSQKFGVEAAILRVAIPNDRQCSSPGSLVSSYSIFPVIMCYIDLAVMVGTLSPILSQMPEAMLLIMPDLFWGEILNETTNALITCHDSLKGRAS